MENINENKKEKEEVDVESVLGTLSEDDLLASSQGSVNTREDKGTSHSTPVHPSQSIANKKGSAPAKVAPKKKSRKSPGTLEKAKYLRALFILKKIERNKANGEVHVRDAEDRVWCEAIVRDYEASLANKPVTQPQQPKRQSAKRDRSHEVSERIAKRGRYVQQNEGASTSAAASAKHTYSEVVRDHLQVALVDAEGANGRRILAVWSSIEGRLSEMVVEHLMENQTPVPSFSCEEVCRGCRVIKCADGFSREFLEKCVAKISNAFDGLSLKIILASEIPRRPRARIWLPKMKLNEGNIVQCLKLQNPGVPMDDWEVLKVEDQQRNSQPVLLLICNESLGALEQRGYKLKFGIRNAKLKIFPAAVAPDNNLEEGDEALRLLDELSLAEQAGAGASSSSEKGEGAPTQSDD